MMHKPRTMESFWVRLEVKDASSWLYVALKGPNAFDNLEGFDKLGAM